MSPKQRPNLAELRVGIFVVISCGVLALAIFAIGSQVGLFEEQFWALTYLSNVSGLKPGDVVLLGGVEVGNVSRVEISKTAAPETEQNRQIVDRVNLLSGQLEGFQQRIDSLEEELGQARERYDDVVSSLGASSVEAQNLQDLVQQRTRNVAEARSTVNSLLEDISRVRAGLQNIEVEMRINEEYRDWIKSDSNISLGSIGLLGDKYIEISLGRADDAPQTTTLPPDTWLGSPREAVLITGTQQASFGELITGANDILANFETLSNQVQDIVRNFEAGEGTIGKFIKDPSFYNNLNQTVENANRAMSLVGELAGDLAGGSGTISRLVTEDELYVRIVSVTEKLETVLTGIEEGEGTLGKFLSDDSVYEQTDQILGEVKEIARRIEAGEGTLGRLSKEDELYISIRDSIDELSLILKDIQNGTGTLGQLAKDEQLYRNLNEVSTEIVKLLYDFRQNPKEFLTIKLELF